MFFLSQQRQIISEVVRWRDKKYVIHLIIPVCMCVGVRRVCVGLCLCVWTCGRVNVCERAGVCPCAWACGRLCMYVNTRACVHVCERLTLNVNDLQAQPTHHYIKNPKCTSSTYGCCNWAAVKWKATGIGVILRNICPHLCATSFKTYAISCIGCKIPRLQQFQFIFCLPALSAKSKMQLFLKTYDKKQGLNNYSFKNCTCKCS